MRADGVSGRRIAGLLLLAFVGPMVTLFGIAMVAIRGDLWGGLVVVLGAALDLIRFRGHLAKGGYDVQTDGRHPQAPAAPAIR